MTSGDFELLQKQWYQKLKEDGFVDIENTAYKNPDLLRYEGKYFIKQYSPFEFEIKQEYYERASEFLHTHVFESRLDEEVWKMHSDGVSVREMAAILKRIGFPSLGFRTVHQILQRLKEDIGRQNED